MKSISVQVKYDIELEEDVINRLFDALSDSKENKNIMFDYLLKPLCEQKPLMEYTFTSGDKTCSFETH